jgi:citrate synthase
MLEAFDMPDTHESCGRRNHTINAPQAMTLLNSKVSLEWAQALAGRLLKEAGTEPKAQVEAAYLLTYGRLPDSAERDTVLTFFETQKRIIAERVAMNEKLALPTFLPAQYDQTRAAALVDFCQMLLNSNEFVYRN